MNVYFLRLYALQMEHFPTTWSFQFFDKDKNYNIILEATVDKKLWFWHVYFGLLDENNDLNVLDFFPLVANILSGACNEFGFQANGNKYSRYYLLMDGIYLH